MTTNSLVKVIQLKQISRSKQAALGEPVTVAPAVKQIS